MAKCASSSGELTREMMVRLYAVDRLPTIEMMVFFAKYELDSRAMLPRFTLLKKKKRRGKKKKRRKK